MATLSGKSQRATAPEPANGEPWPTRFVEDGLEARVRDIVSRRPAVGLAVGVVIDGRLAFFRGHGFADIAGSAPVTVDTVFRIGSVTKVFTATAVLQLVERGLIDLDAPARDYLKSYELAAGGFRPPTIRHLLTHSSGVPDVRRLSDLLHAGLTPDDGRPPLLSVRFGDALPSLANYYRDGLRVVAEPGTAFAYSNHGFATLGQIVEDVSGQPLDGYLREHVFEPLGMHDTDLIRTERIRTRLATGYVLGRHGPTPVPDRDWIGAGAGGAYSTVHDLARYAAALLWGRSDENGPVLSTATLTTMFEPHFQPDPRLPGMGLGLFRGEAGGRRLVYHDGILPGFNSQLLVAPDDKIAIIAVTNGSPGAFGWLGIELDGLLRHVLGVPSAPEHTDVPHRPEIWRELCGRYVYPPRIADLRERLMLGGGAQVLVRRGRLQLRLLTPVPALLRGFPLEPDDPNDPYAFHLDLRQYGMAIVRVVFAAPVDDRAAALHTDLGGQPWSFIRARSGAGGAGPARRSAGASAPDGETAARPTGRGTPR